jgi:two-component system, cell cycle sensor histidine kinase and response regulator CckA
MSVVTTDPGAWASGASTPENWLGAWKTSADPAYFRGPDGRIKGVNASFSRKFGRDFATMVGLEASALVYAEDLPIFQKAVEALTHSPFTHASEQRWITPQGIRWLTWQEAALKDAAGKIIGYRSIGRDTTRQHLAEEQFYRLSRAFEQSPVSTVITDLEGRAQYVNAKFIEVSGHTLEDLIDGKIEVLRDGHPDEDSYQELRKVLATGGEWRGELSTQRGERGTVWESVKVSCLRSPTGEITNYLCLREDVTERKKLEHELRQAQKMESLGTLAGGIAHDFNNLLAIINGYAEFCMQGNADAAVLQKGLREIHRASQRASGLVRQILTFSRKHEIKFAPMDLNQLARDLGRLLAETFPRTVTLQFKLQEDLAPLTADQNQIQQIILNLCVNARDAMSDTGGSITIATNTVPGSSLRHLGNATAPLYAYLQVSDSGSGMTPEVRQRIFEPFFTTKPTQQGTGLGLAVVYGIVTSHHGFIDVESTVGVGSSFNVYLPLTASATLAPSTTDNRDFPGGTESLLIVDDEDSLRTLLATAFARKGYRTATAATGLEAIELVGDTTHQYDLILLDLNMPGANGLEVMKIIRLCRPRAKVLVISGHITPEVRVEFQRLGQREFVQKPYRLDELGRHIRGLLDASRELASA